MLLSVELQAKAAKIIQEIQSPHSKYLGGAKLILLFLILTSLSPETMSSLPLYVTLVWI